MDLRNWPKLYASQMAKFLAYLGGVWTRFLGIFFLYRRVWTWAISGGLGLGFGQFGPIFEGLGLDFGRFGLISGVWAWVLAIFWVFCAYFGGSGPDFGHFRPILRGSKPSLWVFRGLFRRV